MTPFGLKAEVQKANPDQVFAIPVVQLHTRLDQAQFDAAMEVVRRDWRADSRVEAGLRSQRSLDDVVSTARTENAAIEGALAEVATEEMRAAALAAIDVKKEAPQVAEGFEESLEAAPAEPLGTTYIPATVAADLFQSAVPATAETDADGGAALQAAMLENLGISADAYEAAIQNGEDLEIDLDAAIANWNHDPAILKEMVGRMTLEDSASIAEREALLAEIGPPEQVMAAGADVTRETRSDLAKRLKAAGRTADQAAREVEILSRLASTLSRITGQDPNALIREIFRFGREGKEGGVSYFQPTLEEVRTADKALAEDVAAWEKAVDAYPDNLYPHHQITMLRQTPLVLQMIGAKNLRMVVNFGKMEEILGEKHNLPRETLKQVPAAMTDPIAIFDSASQGGDWVMMLDLKDQHGATVIVPIYLESRSGGYMVNVIKSIYGQKNRETNKPRNKWFGDQIADGNLLYKNKKKSREWMGSTGLQWPAGGTPSNTTRKHKVYNYDDLVKWRGDNPTMYQSADLTHLTPEENIVRGREAMDKVIAEQGTASRKYEDGHGVSHLLVKRHAIMTH